MGASRRHPSSLRRSAANAQARRRGSASCVLAAALLAAGCVSSPPAGPPTGDGAPPRAAHGSPADFVETHFAGDAWRDDVVRDYLTAPPVLLPAGLALAAGAVAPWDRSVERNLAGKYGGHTKWGGIALGALVVGSVGAGVVLPGPGRSSGDEFWNLVEAYALTEGATSGLKSVVGRRRPDSGRRGSFPSGHASTAFAAATLLYDNNGPAVGIPAYALAGYTAFSRVEGGRHFPSDALAGAALGTLAAGLIDALHFGTGREGRGISGRGPDVQVGPGQMPGGSVGAVLTIRF